MAIVTDGFQHVSGDLGHSVRSRVLIIELGNSLRL
jgi:hypothetical protein